MKKQVENDASKVSERNIYGTFIYHDNNGHAYYYDIFTKKYYSITAKDLQMYLVYSMRFPLAVATAFIIYYSLKVDIKIALILGAIIYLVLFFLFEFNFLKKLNPARNIQSLKKDSYIERTARGLEQWRILVLMGIALLIIGLSFIYINSGNYSGISIVAFYVIIACAVVYIIMNAIALIKKKKNNYE